MTALRPLLKLPLIFLRRSSEKTAHDPPPGLLAVPLTDSRSVGDVVPMPTLPPIGFNKIGYAVPLPAPLSALSLTCNQIPNGLAEYPPIANSLLPVPISIAIAPATAVKEGLAFRPPNTCVSYSGLAVPMPTLPKALMSMLLVGAPGRIRKG